MPIIIIIDFEHSNCWKLIRHSQHLELWQIESVKAGGEVNATIKAFVPTDDVVI